MWKRIAAFALPLLALFTVTSPALGKAREARIPLHDGRLKTADLSDMLCRELHLPECSFGVGTIDLHGLNGSLFVAGVNESLGDGCQIRVADDALVLDVDTDKLPDDVRTAKKAARVFTATVAPGATAKQRAYYGLWVRGPIDRNRPLVVLIHGLDCDRVNWLPMVKLLEADGRQVGVFTYPSDQPIADSAKSLGDTLADLRLRIPNLSYDLICHSMGGLVARRYVESSDYRGGVQHLIMLGTPNLGSRWAGYRFALEIEEHYDLWRHEPDWSPSWMITDGLGEAGSDLKPRSRFLRELNELPRRDGVKYTIIAGNQHPAREITADAIDGTARCIPKKVSNWWGFRQVKQKLVNKAGRMRQRGESDGPVSVESCRLDGVDDFVIVAADHVGLYYPVDGKKPAAWDTIRDRLSQ